MIFSEKLKFVTQTLKLTLKDLARELGVSFATIKRWKKENYNPGEIARKIFKDFCEKHNLFYAD